MPKAKEQPKAAPRRPAVSKAKGKAPARFRLGYASHLASVRPGVDLTKPTLPPGKFL